MGWRIFDLDPEFTVKKCVESYHTDDRVSRLPDDVLIVILSTLPLKEAGRTSVLSSRWRNLWRHTSCLQFDAPDKMEKLVQELEVLHVGRRKYVKWVNSVLRSHRGLALKEFRISFSLDRSSKQVITKWLEFAFERHVRRLELNLSHGEYSYSDKMYVFPQELVKSHPRTSSNYKTLEALCLRAVEVTGETIEFLLRNCTLLEQLLVHESDKLSSLEVCGHSLVLKQLEILDCHYLTSLKVSAPKLISLSVTKIEGLLLEEVPMLVNVYVHCWGSKIVIQRLVPTLFCCLSQLEILTLDFAGGKDYISMIKFPEMPKLKKLVIMEFLSNVDESLLGLASCIEASPRLQEFVLKQSWCEPVRANREIEKAIMQFPHQHLNVVKFYGYYGSTSDVELVSYFLENCVALEEIIINSQNQCTFLYEPVDAEQLEMEQTARTLAKEQLEPLVPKHIRLVLC
ncbi:hypothetical protein OROMI_034534 [Orobanche minor]